MQTKFIFSSILIISSFILFFLSGCKDSKNCFEDFDSHKTIVVVPVMGCSGCIDMTLQHLRKHHTSERLKFVITRYRNEKELRLEIGNELYNSPNMIKGGDIQQDCKWLFKDHPIIFFSGKRQSPKVIEPNNARKLLNELDSYLEKSVENTNIEN